MAETDSVWLRSKVICEILQTKPHVRLSAVWPEPVRLFSLHLRPSVRTAVTAGIFDIMGGVEQKQVLCISSTFLFPPQNVTWLDRVVRAHYCEIQLEVSVWLLLQNIFFRCVKKNGENVIQVELPQKWMPNKNKVKDSCCLSSL